MLEKEIRFGYIIDYVTQLFTNIEENCLAKLRYVIYKVQRESLARFKLTNA